MVFLHRHSVFKNVHSGVCWHYLHAILFGIPAPPVGVDWGQLQGEQRGCDRPKPLFAPDAEVGEKTARQDCIRNLGLVLWYSEFTCCLQCLHFR